MTCENTKDYITETDNVFITYVGDTFIRDEVVVDSDGNAIDITGYTIYFTVKKSYSDSDTNAVIKNTITTFTSDSEGKYQLVVSSTLTSAMVPGIYVCDIKTKDASDNITTIKNGNFIVKSSVTDDTS